MSDDSVRRLIRARDRLVVLHDANARGEIGAELRRILADVDHATYGQSYLPAEPLPPKGK